MTGGCVPDIINSVEGSIDGCIKPNCEIGSVNIIVYCSGHTDDRSLVFLPKKVGSGESSIASYDNEAIHPAFFEIPGCLSSSRLFKEFLTPTGF